eukprot:228764-Chlamydomonas_euryale.AAC.3
MLRWPPFPPHSPLWRARLAAAVATDRQPAAPAGCHVGVRVPHAWRRRRRRRADGAREPSGGPGAAVGLRTVPHLCGGPMARAGP